jgi:hypothetical protein
MLRDTQAELLTFSPPNDFPYWELGPKPRRRDKGSAEKGKSLGLKSLKDLNCQLGEKQKRLRLRVAILTKTLRVYYSTCTQLSLCLLFDNRCASSDRSFGSSEGEGRLSVRWILARLLCFYMLARLPAKSGTDEVSSDISRAREYLVSRQRGSMGVDVERSRKVSEKNGRENLDTALYQT